MLHGLSRTLREIHRLSREAPANTFQDSAFEAIKDLIKFDTGFWGGGVPPSVLHYVHLHRLPDEMTARFEEVKNHPKMIESIGLALAHAGKAVAIDAEEYGLGFFYCAYGVDQLVTLYQPDADLGLYHVLSLYRRGKERFNEQERLLFEGIVPHLLDAYRENRLLHLAGADGAESPLAPAAALVDREGVVHFARLAFVQLLRREWPDWRGPYLPEAMRRISNGTFAGNEISVRFASPNDLSLAVIRKKGPLDQLTPRELHVAKHVATGASHKDIARLLSIAPSTARNHVAHIHAKLGTNRGSQVAAMLVGEGAALSLDDGVPPA